MASPNLLLGVDIGGTFTDLILFNPVTKKMRFMKVLTTPENHSKGVMEGIKRITEFEQDDTRDIYSVIHGSTIGINTIIERKGAKTGLITTNGFEDILLIGRQTRPRIYDWRVKRPSPLVQGNLRIGVKERIEHTGKILKKLEIQEIHEVASYLKTQNVESVAICLLHSYANPIHENQIKEILEKKIPSKYISTSSVLLPEFREFERMSTTVINSYIGPIVSNYLNLMKSSLIKKGVRQFLVMEANGGLISADDAMLHAVNTIESGPAGGVIAANYIGKLVGRKKLISFDMGGTTAKSSIIIDSMPQITTQYEISPLEQGERLVRGSGYPIKTPVIDLIEVGAGGGSIAWIDSGGALRVGPRSAGANPGPACYCKGGLKPTITDANVVLGRINPNYFLGGEMLLDESASRKVIQALSEELGLGLFETAEGIIEVANSIMARGIRYVTTDRGHDFKEFSLVAFGGAAPVQVIDIADMLGIKEIIIPPSPGVFSAFGFLVADLAHHYVKTSFSICSETSLEKVEKIFRGLEELGAYQLDKDNVSHQDRWVHRSLDMRYIGQSHELNVPVDWPIDMKKVIDRFHSIHLSRYGYSMKNEVVAIVSYRLIALGLRTKPQLIQVTRNNSNISAEKGSRLVHLKDEGFVECFEYERLNLKAGDLVEGPCLIEEWDTTTVIKKGFTGLTDSYGNLIISKGGG